MRRASQAVKAGESTEANVETKRQEGLSRMAAEASKLIDTYLRDGADMQLSLRDAGSKARPSRGSEEAHWRETA